MTNCQFNMNYECKVHDCSPMGPGNCCQFITDAENVEECVKLLVREQYDHHIGQERLRACEFALGYFYGLGYGPKSAMMKLRAIAVWDRA